ncbi:unnamed protein product [Caenorhabditis bovis]|uniref:Serine/threonine-protein phosphatase n=1 Tax=Caenorhabditis bovis TaxID=2654633 RepID=A0A8S1ELT6_9PELO|nr:unnamed protein product [Caenorhabditis bovis]
MDGEKLNLDNIIARLLEVRGSKPGKNVQLTESEIKGLCQKSREIFLSQPILLELEAPLKICGDVHGQYYDLLRLFEYGGFPPESNYLFLGDYVDRGKQSLETICLLLAYKIKYPENFFLLRGNHECASINRIYGFYDECKRRYNIKLWKTFTDCFNCLPVAAIIDEKIFCCHGGLSPDLQSMEQIRRIMRPTDVPDQGLLCDLLWSDPDKDVTGWGENDRGVSFTFGPEVVGKFLHKHDLDLICRAHQVVEDGYEFFAKRQLVTLFSAPNYCGEFDNAGSMMTVDETLMCSFQILKPADKKKFPYGGGVGSNRPVTPPRNAPAAQAKKGMKNAISKVHIDTHPTEQAIVVRFENKIGSSSQISSRSRAASANLKQNAQKIINLKDLNANVDIQSLCNLILQKCPFVPTSSRSELEQALYYLQKRGNQRMSTRSRSSSAVSLERRQMTPINVELERVDEYIEYFYGETAVEKNKGAMAICELSKIESNLPAMVENETLVGALSRVFREDWKRSFDVATNIMSTFVNFSRFSKYHPVLLHHKIGSLCVLAIDHESKRYDSWILEIKKADGDTAKKLRIAIRKQSSLLAACVTLLTNLAVDINVELKMVRRDLVQLLIKCLQMSLESQNSLTLASIRLLLKLSIFEENKLVMEHHGVVEKLVKLFPIQDADLRKVTIKLLFNFSFEPKNVPKMVDGGLVTHIASLIEDDNKALNVLYLLSCNDDAKAMLAFTDAIQLLMRDVLSGQGSEVTKAVLLNTCIEKRNAQLVCGPDGQGLDLLMDLALSSRDLMIVKVVRAIAAHDGQTQNMFLKWVPKLLEIAMADGLDSSESKSSFALECMGTIAELRVAPWAKLLKEHHMIPWMQELLQYEFEEPGEQSVMNDRKPLQLQVVIASGTMARQLEAARSLIPLIDTFIALLQSTQIDDEFVVQLLFVFLQLLRHKELAERLMGAESALGAHMIDLMHDANAAVREICDNALLIMEEHSHDWARRIAGERFKWHNAQWLEMVEREANGNGMYDDEDYGADLNFDHFDDGFDINEPIF